MQNARRRGATPGGRGGTERAVVGRTAGATEEARRVQQSSAHGGRPAALQPRADPSVHVLLHAADAHARTQGVRAETTRERVQALPDLALAYTGFHFLMGILVAHSVYDISEKNVAMQI